MLKGKRAVVTGGGSGFGQALVVWLTREGVDVIFSARRAEDIEETCQIVSAEGGRATGHLCDTASPGYPPGRKALPPRQQRRQK
jgi:NAD(P)-dependent dehydrogenase (short-subunit alcohol dehydrogenase family)